MLTEQRYEQILKLLEKEGSITVTEVKELLNKKASIVIAVSEGIKLADGRYVCELGSVETMWMHLDTNSFREQPLIWQTSWQRSADARQELLNFPHYREVLPTWHPEWILMKHSW